MRIDRNNRKLIVRAFQEDAPRGDLTARFFLKKNCSYSKIISKQTGVIAGLSIAIACFQYISKKIEVIQYVKDGQAVKKGEILLELSGPLEKILLAERTALNFLQHLSGVATATANLVRLLQGTSCKLLDTRKTLPGYRQLEKYAVLCGGGTNHRHSLSDMVLIKENHLRPLTLEQLQKTLYEPDKRQKSK